MPSDKPAAQTTRSPRPMHEECETLDTVEIVRRRLADGRTIADADVHRLVTEIDRLRRLLAMSEADFTRVVAARMEGMSDAKTTGLEEALNEAVRRYRLALASENDPKTPPDERHWHKGYRRAAEEMKDIILRLLGREGEIDHG